MSGRILPSVLTEFLVPMDDPRVSFTDFPRASEAQVRRVAISGREFERHERFFEEEDRRERDKYGYIAREEARSIYSPAPASRIKFVPPKKRASGRAQDTYQGRKYHHYVAGKA